MEIVLIDWRQPVEAIRPKAQIDRLQNCGLANIVVANENGVGRKKKLGSLDASKIAYLYSCDSHVGPEKRKCATEHSVRSSTIKCNYDVPLRSLTVAYRGRIEVLHWIGSTADLEARSGMISATRRELTEGVRVPVRAKWTLINTDGSVTQGPELTRGIC